LPKYRRSHIQDGSESASPPRIDDLATGPGLSWLTKAIDLGSTVMVLTGCQLRTIAPDAAVH